MYPQKGCHKNRSANEAVFPRNPREIEKNGKFSAGMIWVFSVLLRRNVKKTGWTLLKAHRIAGQHFMQKKIEKIENFQKKSNPPRSTNREFLIN